jgi:hypothetical protein
MEFYHISKKDVNLVLLNFWSVALVVDVCIVMWDDSMYGNHL